jgi:uridine kinase
MFTITLKKNSHYLKQIAIAHEMTVSEIADDNSLREALILAYKIDEIFVSPNKEIKENCILDVITIESLEGFRIYQDTALFILMKAFHQIMPENIKLVVEHSVGDGVFCEIFGGHQATEEDAERLEKAMWHIIEESLPIIKEKLEVNDVIPIFERFHRKFVIKNLKHQFDKPNCIYKCGDYYDLWIRQLAYNTKLIQNFKIEHKKSGILIRFPQFQKFAIEEEHLFPIKLFNVHQEYDKWLNVLKAHYVSELNEYVEYGGITDFILTEEALQESKIVKMAEYIKSHSEAKLVLIAGPSSSGKTTFAKRLSIQLKAHEISPIVISMDNYFLPRTQTPRKPDGELDFESIYAMDLELLNHDLQAILSGKEIELPRYNFIKGIRESSNQLVRLEEKQIIIMEGIHGINEQLTKQIPHSQKIKIYITALNQLNIDEHNRIPTTDTRKIRRIVRDFHFRGYSAEETLMRWASIREGEEKYIFPFQEDADIIFNSALTYELGVLKPIALPLLMKIPQKSHVYMEAVRLKNILLNFVNINLNIVPINSLLREFAGGSIFKY